MFNPVLDKLPTSINVCGQIVNINTDFRLFLKFITAIKKQDDTLVHKCLMEIIGDFKVTKDNVRETIKAVSDFMLDVDRREKEAPKSNSKPTFDFTFDADIIYSDFKRTDIYNIDLLTASLHWYEFKLLLNGLPENSSVEKRKNLRSLTSKDVAKNKVSKLKELQSIYEIPVELTAEQEEAIGILKQLRGEV